MNKSSKIIKRNSNKAPKPVGKYPHSVEVNNMLFISGIGPRNYKDNSIPGNVYDANKKLIEYDITKQCHAVFENITCRNAVFETVECKDALIETANGKDAIFGNIVITDDVACRNLAILDVDEGEAKALLGLDTNGNGRLVMYGDDSNYPIAYLGENEKTNEMILQLQSKSKIDKRQVMMMIGENGGRFDSLNKIGESINSLKVGSDSGRSLDVRVKDENKK